jgi:hypothetical protein
MGLSRFLPELDCNLQSIFCHTGQFAEKHCNLASAVSHIEAAAISRALLQKRLAKALRSAISPNHSLKSSTERFANIARAQYLPSQKPRRNGLRKPRANTSRNQPAHRLQQQPIAPRHTTAAWPPRKRNMSHAEKPLKMTAHYCAPV